MISNIVLIGMPGSGKSKLGLMLSNRMRMVFLDTDRAIENRFGMSITDLFTKHGEDKFRDIEAEVVMAASRQKNLVIATGGGVVLNNTNMIHLQETGIVIYLKRSCESILQTANMLKRPLLTGNPELIYEIYEQRKGLYEKYADYIIENESRPETAVNKICEVVHEINGN